MNKSLNELVKKLKEAGYAEVTVGPDQSLLLTPGTLEHPAGEYAALDVLRKCGATALDIRLKPACGGLALFLRNVTLPTPKKDEDEKPTGTDRKKTV